VRARTKRGVHAVSLPLPIRVRGKLRIAFLVYGEPAKQGQELVYPPSELAEVDPRTGKAEFRPCGPADFGIDAAPNVPVNGFGVKVRGDEFWRQRDRLMDIAPHVWAAFETGGLRVVRPAFDLVREHDEIFERIAKAPLKPYYAKLGAEYWAWSRALAGP